MRLIDAEAMLILWLVEFLLYEIAPKQFNE